MSDERDEKIVQLQQQVERLTAPVSDAEMPDHRDDWGVKCCYKYEVDAIIQARLASDAKESKA